MQRRVTAIADVVEQMLERRKMKSRLFEARVFSAFASVAGPGIAQHARAVRLRGGELTINVDSASWRQQLQFLSETLREKLNQELGQVLVKSFRLMHGPLPTIEIIAPPAPPPKAETIASFEQRVAADSLSRLITDHELAAQVARTYLSAKLAEKNR